jgi:hypothetical protein
MFLDDGRGEPLGEDETVAHSQPTRSFREGTPRAAAELAVKGDLDKRLAAAAGQPRRDHLGVVEDEQIARPQQCRQIGDLPVLEPTRCGNNQQTSSIARLARMRRDQLAGQTKIEIVDVHRVRGAEGALAPLSSIGSASASDFC